MKWTIILSLVLLFTACGNREITEGTVIKKEFKPASTQTQRRPHSRTHITRGNSNTITTYSLEKVAYPDRWIIYVQAENDTADFFVNKEVYNTVEVGSWFVFDTTMGTVDEPYKLLKK